MEEELSLEDIAMGKRPKSKSKKEPKIGDKAKAKIAKVMGVVALMEKANMAMVNSYNEEEVEAMLDAHRELRDAQGFVMDMLRTAKNKYERAERKSKGKKGMGSCGYEY